MTQLTESLWGDEGFSAVAVMRPLGEMLGVVMRDTAPPLFYLVGWLWGRLFGFSESALRSLTLFLVAGAGVFAGLLVWRLTRQKIMSLLTFALVLTSPFLFQFAFEWRMYALLAFTLTGSIYFYISRRWGWYVIFTLAALYTHHFAVFTVVLQGLWFVVFDLKWSQPRAWIGQLRPFWLVGLFYLPWLYPMYLQIARVKGGGFWLGKPTLGQALTLLVQFATAGVPQKMRWLVGLVAGGIMVGKDWAKLGRKWWLLAVLFLGPVALAFGVSHLVTPIFYDRYLLSVVVGMGVLIALGTRKKLTLLVAVLVGIYSYYSWLQFTHPAKRPFRDLASYVKTQVSAADMLINYNGRAHHLWESKYYGVAAPIYSPGGPLPFYTGTAQMNDADVIYDLPSVNRLGVIASDPVDTLSLPGFKLESQHSFGDLSFSWWMKLNGVP